MIRTYNPKAYSKAIAYMLQSTEYEWAPYVTWLTRVKSTKKLMYRRKLEPTKAARLFRNLAFMLLFSYYILLIVASVYAFNTSTYALFLGLFILFMLGPYFVGLIVVVPLVIANIFVRLPKQKRLIQRSKSIFAHHPGTKIAVAGSYGKTSMKEMLGVVLGSEKNVAITPANKNVASSHALFASKLSGKEDVLIVEFGEGKPGDVKKFTATVQPDLVVVTGIAPAHLDKYKTMQAVTKDILSATDSLEPSSVYINGDGEHAGGTKKDWNVYSAKGADDCHVSQVHVHVNLLRFEVKTKHAAYKIKTGLVGRHTIGPLIACILIAEKIGISKQAIETSIAGLTPYEHRMQPRPLQGAWIIDDTYNGNVEGIKAGLAFLKEIDATRKIYVTPGLVDQGSLTTSIHREIGKHIADASPDIVVLMKNSVTKYIQQGLKDSGFTGQIRIESDPLSFYTHIADFIATGDVVLMQNDWTDNYA